MKPIVSDRLRPFGTTIFAEMTRLAAEHDAVNLSQGFPDFDGPAFVREAAQRAIDQGHNQYARPAGELPLVRAVADDFSRRVGVARDPLTEVTVTAGCTEAIAATMLGLLNPGDEVVLFEPYYDSYRACVALAGATPRFVAMRPNDAGRFEIDEAELQAAFTPRTRAVLVNTPHNPTGTVLSREELSRIGALAAAHDAAIIADEVYEHLTFGVPHVSIASLPGLAERTVTLSSFGKSYSMTGWKIGWAVAPAPLTAGIRAAHQFLTFAVSTPMQHAAAVAVREGSESIAELRRDYTGARDMLASNLQRLGWRVHRPEGAYFIMAGHDRISRRLGLDPDAPDADVTLARRLISEVGVATIPPSVFCARPELASGFLRFAFCKRSATLEEAVRRLERLA